MDAPQCPGCRERDARIAALEARVAELEALVKELTRKLDALTKSRQPPRGQAELPKGPAKKPSGKAAGGQPGHPPHGKLLLRPERVQRTVTFVPKTCAHCQHVLPTQAEPNDLEPTRHQIVEVPELAAYAIEYQGHARTCPACGQVTRAALPAAIRAQHFGPRLTATLAYFAGSHGVSKRGVAEIAAAVFAVPLGLGTVSNLEQEMSAALAPAHREAVRAVRRAAIKNVDETGWKRAGHKRWLWTAAAKKIAVFVIHKLRNLTALRQLIGRKLRGILGSDRLRTYDHMPVLQRQICWAHLKRNWEKMVERGGKARAIGAAALRVQERVFELWHLFRGGGCSRAELDDRMVPLMFELADILRAGARCRDAKTKRFCTRLAAVFPALWTFVVVRGVEPTNNHAERVLRRAVLWRRRSFGCHSDAGCRFVERLLTVVQSLRLQGRSILQFLYQTITAHRWGGQRPKLLCAE